MRKTSLNELMGKSGDKKSLSLDDLENMLGEKMPKLEFSPVGRLRLTSALRMRFGENYRNLPGMDSIMKEFDNEAKFNVKLQEMKQIKARK